MVAFDSSNTVLSRAEMHGILESVSIEGIGLSVRSHNALRRAGVHTVNAMLELSREQMQRMKNLGAKSIDEIERLQNEINGDPCATIIYDEEKEEAPFFFDTMGMQRKDIPISELALSYRSNRLLTEAGYKFASELLDVTEEQLLAIRNMGRGSANEIMDRVASIGFDEIKHNDEGTTQAEKECMDFISSFISCVPAIRRELFQVLLPHFKKAEDNNASIDKNTVLEEPLLRKHITDKLVAILKENAFGMDMENIYSLFPNELIATNLVSVILDEMSMEGLVHIGQTVKIIRPTLWEYVESIADEKQREMLKLRLQGKTLEEIGAANGEVTRERVRQIILKCMRGKRKRIEEDKYREIYKTYSFSKEDFMLAFDLNESVYIYLTLVCDKVGKLPIEQFLDDTDYPIELRKGAERAVYKNYFNIGGLRVYKRRTELADYVCHAYFQNEATFSAFVKTYNNVLRNLGIADDSRFILNERTYQNRFADAENVLWKYQSRFRYYDMKGRDFTALLEGLQLEQYVDVEYSTLKFLRSYPELMEEYDIRDEYELHNLLKKLYAKMNNTNIKFSRMPIIEFGKADRNNQILDLLILLAPIDVKGFCEAYEAEYGVLARTVAGSFISCIDEYRSNNGMFDISAESLPTNQMEKMRELLTDDYYDILSIMQLYSREFSAENPNMINSYTLKNLGFRVLSSYVIKDNYASAAEYFRHILTAEDIVDARNFSTTLKSQISYTSELYSLRSNYEIVEYEPLRYINRRRLESLGVSTQDMNNYCNSVSEFVQPKAYFTIRSIRQQGFTHPLDELNFSEWFYASILTEDKERFCYQRIGGTKVFCQSVKQITMESIFKNILENYDGINIYDFIGLLKNEYDINVNKHKIIEVINTSTMYYDRIMERIYQNSVVAYGLLSDEDQIRAKHIVSTKFTSGYRTSSNIDFERFVRFYASEYEEEFSCKASSLDSFLASVAVIFDDRAYVYNIEVINSVRAYLEQLECPCIFIDSFFEKYSGELYSFGIFGVDLLKAFIEKKYNDIFCKHDYIYLRPDISISDLIRNVYDEKEIWSLDELYARLPLLKPDTIRQILNREEYFRVETGVYIHIDHMDLPGNEGEKVANAVSDRLQSKDYVIANELDLSQFERLNPHYPFTAVRDAVFIKFLSNRYSKTGQVITRKGEKLSVLDILEQYCREAETVSFDELNSFEATFDPDGRTHSQCLIAAHNVLVRVSNDLFVTKDKVNFDIDSIDETISLYCQRDFIPLKKIIDFSLLPYAGYSWNLFLLESYVRKYSRKFKFDVRAVNSSNIGVIVRKSFAYDEYDDILSIALAQTHISLRDTKAVGDYLFDNGYIGWRNLGKSEEKILSKARTIREGGVV